MLFECLRVSDRSCGTGKCDTETTSGPYPTEGPGAPVFGQENWTHPILVYPAVQVSKQGPHGWMKLQTFTTMLA